MRWANSKITDVSEGAASICFLSVSSDVINPPWFNLRAGCSLFGEHHLSAAGSDCNSVFYDPCNHSTHPIFVRPGIEPPKGGLRIDNEGGACRICGFSFQGK